MTRRTSSTIFSRSALAALATIGLMVACGPREPTTDAERLTRGRELVQQMSARLAGANAVSVTTTEVRDRVRASGAKESVPTTGLYIMQRPNRFYSKATGGRGLESWYNGKTLTIALNADKVFAQAPMPDTIDRTLDVLAERYDLALPMGDLFYGSAEKALLSDTTTGGYAGKEDVGGTPCVHLAFQGHRRRLGTVAAGRGRSPAEAAEGRAETAYRPARGRSHVHGAGNSPRRSPMPRSSRNCRRTTRASPSCSGPRRSRTPQRRRPRSQPRRPRSNDWSSQVMKQQGIGQTILSVTVVAALVAIGLTPIVCAGARGPARRRGQGRQRRSGRRPSRRGRQR